MDNRTIPWHHCALTPRHITARAELTPNCLQAYCLGCGKIIDTIEQGDELSYIKVSLEGMRMMIEQAHAMNQEGGQDSSG